jgi:hypothetical protein
MEAQAEPATAARNPLVVPKQRRIEPLPSGYAVRELCTDSEGYYWYVVIVFEIDRHTLGMNEEASLQFHIEENDCFGTLATVLDLVSQDLQKKGHRSNAETLVHMRDRLMHLQQGYRIDSKDC